MTPFGQKVRDLRQAREITLKDMAKALNVSSAYLSALEHGRRGVPTTAMVHEICAYFGLIWDDAEDLRDLAQLSHPRIVVDTSGLSPQATEIANRLSRSIRKMPDEKLDAILDILNTK